MESLWVQNQVSELWAFLCVCFFIILMYFILLKKFFYWSVVDLQCCVSFRCTAKWISYTYTYIHSFLGSFPIYVITEYWVEFPVLYSRSLLVIYFIYSSVYMSIPISRFIPPPQSSELNRGYLSTYPSQDGFYSYSTETLKSWPWLIGVNPGGQGINSHKIYFSLNKLHLT